MNAPTPSSSILSRWSEPGSSRVPFWAYTDEQPYQRELEKIFYGPHWCYVGLEVEIPNTGDFKLSHVGERQVVLVRDRKKLGPDSKFVSERSSAIGGPADGRPTKLEYDPNFSVNRAPPCANWATANYAVFRMRPAGISEVYNVGRYVDEIGKTGDGLKFRRRLCVYDSEMILNSLIYPV